MYNGTPYTMWKGTPWIMYKGNPNTMFKWTPWWCVKGLHKSWIKGLPELKKGTVQYLGSQDFYPTLFRVKFRQIAVITVREKVY